MKKLMPIYEEISSETFHIVVIFSKKDSKKLAYLTEGKWIKSYENGYSVRLDKPKFDFEKLHVHIAKQKHINAKNKQVAWNDAGTRHDKKTFNNNFTGMEKAKQIARTSLGLPVNFQLESISDQNTGELLLESVEYLPCDCNVYVFETNQKHLLKG